MPPESEPAGASPPPASSYADAPLYGMAYAALDCTTRFLRGRYSGQRSEKCSGQHTPRA
jgi:hypothetical protein